MSTWNILITRPSPSLSQERTVFEADTYEQAVQVARDAFFKFRRPVTLGSREYGMDNWYRVDSDGVATNRNTHTNVPLVENLFKGAL